ncbi:hypothetical protein ACN38_g4695 [Penicillium nordicum]|uniref:Uncharacterized protein n=1 Tax=Penicillium nordicum TaxID=229535 RepID=A0A0M9WGV4_9EURO|nr:hypothetical protein ACN38_g4695 [Penicillium nordicum]
MVIPEHECDPEVRWNIRQILRRSGGAQLELNWILPFGINVCFVMTVEKVKHNRREDSSHREIPKTKRRIHGPASLIPLGWFLCIAGVEL